MMAEKTESPFIHSSDEICTKKNRLNEQLGFFVLWACAVSVILVLTIAFGYIFLKGYKEALSFSYLFGKTEGGRGSGGGILYPLIGTFYAIICSLGFAGPLGVFAAIYLSEYADSSSRIVKWSRFAIDSLAGIPSVIYGLFGLAFFVSFLGFKHSILSGSLSLAIMILPVIIRTAEEAIISVPKTFRDASYALGADKVQTIFKVVLPLASRGILTGIMLSIGRVISESAVLILAAGGSITAIPRIFGLSYPFLFPDSGRTLAVHLFFQATSYDSTTKVFATAVVLILIILLLNLIAIFALQSQKKFQKF
jgi:phosphate transport system permease protein